MKKEIEVIGLPISGPEEDFLETEGSKDISGICSLLHQIGIESISSGLAWKFEFPWKELLNSENEFERRQAEKSAGEIQRWCKENQRNCPPVFKIKFIVEAEELSEEEQLEFWKKKRESHA